MRRRHLLAAAALGTAPGFAARAEPLFASLYMFIPAGPGGGAQGVGRATTNSVVSASIMILVVDYMLTELFFATR